MTPSSSPTCFTQSSSFETSSALPLLSAAIDPAGWICIVGMAGKSKPIHKYYPPGDYEGAVQQAALFDSKSMDTYFCTSSMKSNMNRTAENVHSVKVLKLDLDVGEGENKYATRAEALQDTMRVCQIVNMPRPTFVGSGYGAYAYWIGDRAMEPKKAIEILGKMKSVFIHHGLRADPACTADIARLLRVPGTHNYKFGGKKKVKIANDIMVYEMEVLISTIEAAHADISSSTTDKAVSVDLGEVFDGMTRIPPHIQTSTIDETTRQLIGYMPKKFSIILAKSEAKVGCAQIWDVYVNRETIGYDLWRAGLSIAYNCEDGEEAIHIISEGGKDYTPQATIEKAVDTQGKPHTCRWFNSNKPALCKNCLHAGKITSPIQLGEYVPPLKINAGTDAWSAPDSLPSQLLPVDSFDIGFLPASLKEWVKDIVERMQCPLDFVGVTVMSALGTVIGRRVGIRPKKQDDWTEYPNLWTCIVGRPGVMKSPAMSAALAPLNSLSAQASRQYHEDRTTYDAHVQLHAMRAEAQKKNLAKKLAANPNADVQIDEIEAPTAPTLKRYMVNDATVECLLDICIENPQGICAYRDELVALLKSLDREGQESARGFYLTGWNGNSSHTSDRIGRGRNLRADAVCLSMLGSTQPGRIAEYLRAALGGGIADDGLIQRFGLLVWPDIGGKWQNIDRWPDGAAKKAAFELFEQLNAADPVKDWKAEIVTGHDGQPVVNEPPYLRLDDNAADLFLQWRTNFENELLSGNLHPALESHFSKYRKLIPSLALVCHLADDGTGPVTSAAMERALAWAAYLRTHAERSYAAVTMANVASAKALLKHIRSSELQNGFTARDIRRKQWSGLSTQEDVNQALAMLVDYGWLQSVVQQTEGRSKSIYLINPCVMNEQELNLMIAA